MKWFFKTIRHAIPVLLLSVNLFLGIFGDFIFHFEWGDGIFQTLNEDDTPKEKPIAPNG